MKWLALLLFALQPSLVERLGYPADTKLLIVHADDLGMAHSVNAATFQAFESGLVNSGSIMVPCPWFPEAANYARRNPSADLGLHLTLTSEWALMKWSPLRPAPSLVDANGYLFATESEAAAKMSPKEAEAEIRAQISKARAAGVRPTHLDSHMGTLYQTKELFEVFLRVARDEKIPARISRAHAEVPWRAELLRPDDIAIDQIISIGSDVPAEKWEEWYTDAIRNLKPGVTEIIAHIAYDDAEMRAVAIDHPNWGAAWRQRDLDFLTSERFRALLRENGVQLIQWRDLAKLIGPDRR
jgi:chitin disaccharide deacetylase